LRVFFETQCIQSTLSLLSGGGEVRGQDDFWARFAVIEYVDTEKNFVYSARRYDNKSSSYICQQQQQGLFCSVNIIQSTLFNS